MTKERHNHPIRMKGDTLDPQKPIGYATFSEALAAWCALFPTNPIFTARSSSTPSA
jgi:hypothetical protein